MKKLFYIFAILLPLCTFSVLADATTGITLNGTVVNEKSGKPIEGATVSITPASCKATTDKDGKWTISACNAPENYTIKIVCDGYKDADIPANEFKKGDTTPLFEATPQEDPNIVKLPIFGHVHTPQGAALKDVTVQITNINHSGCNTKTNKEGYWKIDKCEYDVPKTAKISFTHTNYDEFNQDINTYTNNSTIKMSGWRGGNAASMLPLNGKVTSDIVGQNPLAGITVMIRGTTCSAITDQNGQWKIDTCSSTIPDNPVLHIGGNGYLGKDIKISTFTNGKNIPLVNKDCETSYSQHPGGTKFIRIGHNGPCTENMPCEMAVECYPSACDTDAYTLENANTTSARCVEKECKPAKAKSGVWMTIDGKKECQVKECINDKYKPNNDNTACIKKLKKCPDEQHTELVKAGASETGLKEDNKTCIATECKCGYTLNGEKCEPWPTTGLVCRADTKPSLPNNTKRAIMKCNSRNKAYCEVMECEPNYEPNDDNTKCIVLKGECTHSDPNAKKTKYDDVNGKRVCVIKKCKDGYLPSDDEQKCEVSEGKCNESQLKTVEHATAGELKKGKCRATACAAGYEVKKHKCVEIEGNCNPKPENAKKSHREFDQESGTEVCIIDECKKDYKISDDKKSCIEIEKAKLSLEDSKKKIDELEKNAQAMKDKEQSTANKMLGGATMAATGLGAMQAMSAYSEQQSDEDAERAMKAYLATFHCNYAPGKNIQGGEMNVQLPGGNELVNLYAEYVNLANNLKVRKAALEMRPGIESESILDSAMTGLYDDVAIGKTTGAFTSLARALQNPDGEDAKAWAAQKEETAQDLKTGLTVAGIGAVAGMAGNLLINHNSAKENSKEINKKYEKLKQKIEQIQTVIDQLPPPTCNDDNYKSSGVSGGTHPNCTCTNTKARFHVEKGCYTCDSGQEFNTDNQCVPIGCKLTGFVKKDLCVCIDTAKKENNECTCKLTGVVETTTCTCGEYTTRDGDDCKCQDNYEIQEGKCVKKEDNPATPIVDIASNVQPPVSTEPLKLNISADTTFDSGKATLKPNAKQKIAEVLKNALDDETKEAISEFKITVTGHTDRVPFRKGSSWNNEKLSKARAEAIAKLLTDAGVPDALITTEGKADTECTQAQYPKNNDPNCRRVNVVISADTTGLDLSNITNSINLGDLVNNLTSSN